MYLPEAKALHVLIPDRLTQDAIAEVLGALDDKIAANTRQIELLQSYLTGAYARALAADSRIVRLEEVAQFHNRRRIPLSASEREARAGEIPYYGASGVFGFVDEPIFNERLLLVGEDGSVITEQGTSVSQYVWGPAWVNNHAHVLTGVGISTELLYVAVSGTQVGELVTGAVQPKISMTNLKRLPLRLPVGAGLTELTAAADQLMAVFRMTSEENRTLAATRDALLPQLMSGRLRVKDAERVVGEVV